MEIFSSNNKHDDMSTISASKTEHFECNICSDSDLNEPVITLCGHLYCWPCIYQWLHRLQISSDSDHHDQPKPNCPVCKAEISDALLVPLYGRGPASGRGRGRGGLGVVPRRPAPPKLDIDSGNYQLGGYSHFFEESCSYDQPFGTVQDLVSGSETPSYSYLRAAIGVSGNPNSYPPAGVLSGRTRRREMRMERSLQRVSFFVFCCFVMCLLFFWFNSVLWDWFCSDSFKKKKNCVVMDLIHLSEIFYDFNLLVYRILMIHQNVLTKFIKGELSDHWKTLTKTHSSTIK